MPSLITGNFQADSALVIFVVGLALALRVADKNRAAKSRALWLSASLALIAASVVLFASALNAAQSQSANVPIDEQAAALGKRVYAEHCAACHGEKGRGDGARAAQLPIAPADLAAHGFHHDDAAMAAIIQRGMGAMPGFAEKLSSVDISNVIQYVRVFAREGR